MKETIYTLSGAFLVWVAGIIKDYFNHKFDINKIRFNKLHDKQACVVGELYSKIVNVKNKADALFSPWGTMTPEERLPLEQELR